MLQGVLGGLEPNFMQAACHTWCHRQGRCSIETSWSLLGNTAAVEGHGFWTQWHLWRRKRTELKKDLAKKSECVSAPECAQACRATWQRSEGECCYNSISKHSPGATHSWTEGCKVLLRVQSRYVAETLGR